jgi:hypothetical protein
MKLSAQPPDLSSPSFSAARQLARQCTIARMRSEGRAAPNAADGERFAREFAGLLWHVPLWQGGFCHGDDRSVRAQARRLGLRKHYANARGALSEWPQRSAWTMTALSSPASIVRIADDAREGDPGIHSAPT